MIVKRIARSAGWFIRKTRGLPVGVDIFADLKRFGIRPKCVFDIGAHHGQSALAYAQGFLGSIVFTFEPEPENFSHLKAAVAGNPDIVPVNAAVSDRQGKVSINIHPENSQGHSIVPAIGDASWVVATTIDDFCAEHRLFPDFIKIDVEGHELQVIAGARHTLTKSPRAILVEATLNPSNARHTQLANLTASLAAYGFRLVAIHDQNLWETTGQLEFFNALFIKR